MTVTEGSRHRLHQALDRTIGAEEATTLMEHLPPAGWSDVATKQDLAHLEERIDLRFDGFEERIDLRFAAVDRRFEQGQEALDHRFAALDHRFEAIDHRFEAADTRMAQIEQRLAGIDARLAHQFWQMLGFLLVFGGTVIGLVRYG